MNPRVDGILVPDIIFGTLGSFHAAFEMEFTPETNSLTYIVHSVIIPTFNLILSVVKRGLLNPRRGVAVEALSQSIFSAGNVKVLGVIIFPICY